MTTAPVCPVCEQPCRVITEDKKACCQNPECGLHYVWIPLRAIAALRAPVVSEPRPRVRTKCSFGHQEIDLGADIECPLCTALCELEDMRKRTATPPAPDASAEKLVDALITAHQCRPDAGAKEDADYRKRERRYTAARAALLARLAQPQVTADKLWDMAEAIVGDQEAGCSPDGPVLCLTKSDLAAALDAVMGSGK